MWILVCHLAESDIGHIGHIGQNIIVLKNAEQVELEEALTQVMIVFIVH
jgi:hypothetical protein